MIELEISPDILLKAKLKADELGSLKKSFLNGKGNLTGFLGEALAQSFIGGREENTFEYDIISPSGHTIDVKSKKTAVKPLPHYECSIPAYSHQKCDFYFFVRIEKNTSVGWILGYKESSEYFKEATFLKKGTVDPSNNFVLQIDSYNLPISNLQNDYARFI